MAETKEGKMAGKPAPAAKPTQKHEIKGTSPKTRSVLGQKDTLLDAFKRLVGLKH